MALAEAGADVTITFLESAREAQQTVKQLEKLGVRALAIPCDVTNPKSVRAAVSEVVRRFNRLDILINNAGRYETVAFDRLSLQQWDTIFATNVREVRKQLGMSQERLAEVAGLHRTYIGSVERGERNISIDNIDALAKALRTTCAELLTPR